MSGGAAGGPAATPAAAEATVTIRSELDRVRRTWQQLGSDDPLWAVLSSPDKRGGRWDIDEFFASGRGEIDNQLDIVLPPLGLPKQRRLAVDFGCGAGRLTRALGRHFSCVIGLDVSASMVRTARRLNADVSNIAFRENGGTRLEIVADRSVDFLSCCIVLQHIPASLQIAYIAEFFRVLAPGGVAMFQFVVGPDDSSRGRLYGRLSNRWMNPLRRIAWRRWNVFEMHALSESAVVDRLAADRELRLVMASDDQAAGPGWRSRRWHVAREPSPA